MTVTKPIKGKKINKRRLQLEKNRTQNELIFFWRSLIAMTILGGLGWLLIQPNWIIKENSQIDITGNQILSEDAVRNLISLSYPQSIFQLPIPQLTQELENKPPLQFVKVNRQLLPPRIKVIVTERLPVAIALDSNSPQDAIGFLDHEGIFLPENFYSSVKENFVLPKLTVIGFQEEKSLDWSQLYQLVSESKIQIKQIDARDSSNLILITELGKVYLGSNRQILLEQLKVLAQMTDLPSKIKIQDLEYIDLTDPSNPLIQVFEVKAKAK
jgi:cell division protein FtsQ